MKGPELKAARRARGWSQQEAAARLGVTQAYLSMLEQGRRRLSLRMTRKLAGAYRLSPTVLPLPAPEGWEPPRQTNQEAAEDLALLGYPGFLHFSSRRARKNPAELLMTALSQDDLEGRVVEGLPWLLLAFSDLNLEWLVRAARSRNLQNRLGYVTELALDKAHDASMKTRLAVLVTELQASRLAAEDTLCEATLTAGERNWLRQNRPPRAAHWNLLTDLGTRDLQYAG